MAKARPDATADQSVEVNDQQAPSPAASTSSREETRDTRERLKKTSIAGLSQKSHAHDALPNDLSRSDASITDTAAEVSNGVRGRPAKKRSFEDLAKDDADAEGATAIGQPPLPKSGHHKRMRSRDVNSGDQTQAYAKIGGDTNDTLHEETDVDPDSTPGGPGVLVDAPSKEEMEADAIHESQSQTTKPAEDTKITTSDSTTRIPATSGFANTSTTSAFAAAKSSEKAKSPEPTTTTSTSAFASSGLSAFASSDKSPFGAAAGAKSPSGTGGGFGGPSTGGFGSTKTGFGGSGAFGGTSTSTFGASSGAFGATKPFRGTSAFGAPKPFGATSSFGGGSSTFGSGKPFTSGTKEADDEDEGDNDGDEDAASTTKDDAEQDPRFREQQIETGETGEEAHFQSRARIYAFDGVWKERGTGNLKINIRLAGEESSDADADPEAQASTGKRKARLLMRADATHRVILNSPVFKGMKFGAADGSEPTGKVMHLQSLEEGKPVPLQIKIGKEEVLKELYNHLLELEKEA